MHKWLATMGLFKRLLGGMGYVKLADYGLELTEHGIVPIGGLALEDLTHELVDDVDGPYAVGSIVDGAPVPDSPVVAALEAQMTEPTNIGEADTIKVIVDKDLAGEIEEETSRAKFLEADTVPAKKI